MSRHLKSKKTFILSLFFAVFFLAAFTLRGDTIVCVTNPRLGVECCKLQIEAKYHSSGACYGSGQECFETVDLGCSDCNPCQ